MIHALPPPFEIQVSLKKTSDIKIATKLKLRENQLLAIDSDVSNRMLQTYSNATLDTQLEGAKIFNCESSNNLFVLFKLWLYFFEFKAEKKYFVIDDAFKISE